MLNIFEVKISIVHFDCITFRSSKLKGFVHQDWVFTIIIKHLHFDFDFLLFPTTIVYVIYSIDYFLAQSPHLNQLLMTYQAVIN